VGLSLYLSSFSVFETSDREVPQIPEASAFVPKVEDRDIAIVVVV